MGYFRKESQTVQINGRDLRCLICSNDTFYKKEAQLNTALATFFKLDWANSSALCIICENCGYIHWFSPR